MSDSNTENILGNNKLVTIIDKDILTQYEFKKDHLYSAEIQKDNNNNYKITINKLFTFIENEESFNRKFKIDTDGHTNGGKKIKKNAAPIKKENELIL